MCTMSMQYFPERRVCLITAKLQKGLEREQNILRLPTSHWGIAKPKSVFYEVNWRVFSKVPKIYKIEDGTKMQNKLCGSKNVRAKGVM